MALHPTPHWTLTCVLACSLYACGPGTDAQENATARQGSAVVYGEDDRLDVFAHEGLAANVATESVVALVPPQFLEPVDGGGYRPNSESARELLQLCPEEPYGEQPSVAACSGVLIAEDLVLTAGHCFVQEDSCDTYAYVFNYHYSRQDQPLEIKDLEVYGCERIVSRKLGDTERGQVQDFAVVQLDRPVAWSRRPVAVATESPRQGDPLAVIGFPQGLPAKIDAGATVQGQNPERGYWYADTDTFGGSSGSPVFNADLALAGILVQGRQDYKLDASRDCLQTARLPDSGALDAYERVADVGAIVETLCGPGTSETQLCAQWGFTEAGQVTGHTPYLPACTIGRAGAPSSFLAVLGAPLLALLLRRLSSRASRG